MRVLIVEDEVLVAAELAWLVEDLGHDVVGEAATSADALRLAGDTRPDLALVDIHLYDGPTGVEVARRISAESGATVLFMTANQKRVPADFAGAAGLVPKPYSIHGMQEAIAFVEQCMAEGRAMAEPPHSLKVAPAFTERLCGRSA
ncbi:response regulator [Caulobacter sp. 17J80-11]|uniref:response regulator n=1 Tax=Caulobacter sp. 17J80-11 TaxID=2763502 RepID=UPI001653A468|nr:response regulator [Caulobacter sp. 17J80-11]MBC6981842.1 response regulator [Caulobacter sp. 17J80-11]